MLKLVDWFLILVGWFWIQGNFLLHIASARQGLFYLAQGSSYFGFAVGGMKF